MAAFFAGYRVVIEEDAKMFDHPTGVNVEFRRKVRTLAGNYQLVIHCYYPALELLEGRARLFVACWAPVTIEVVYRPVPVADGQLIL